MSVIEGQLTIDDVPQPDPAVAFLFHVLARSAAGRLAELAPAERSVIASVCEAKESDFPRQSHAVRALLDSLPDAPTDARYARALWDRSPPSLSYPARPISHGSRNGLVEQRNVERLEASPGALDGARERVLRALVGSSSRFGGSMTKKELAEVMGLTRDNVHPRVMELEVGGWVSRVGTCTGPRNGVLFAPTAKSASFYLDQS